MTTTSLVVAIPAGGSSQQPDSIVGSTYRVSITSARTGSIVFMRPGEVGAFGLWVVRPDGSHPRQITRSPKARDDHNPVWGPDGTTIIYERRKLDSSRPGPIAFGWATGPRSAPAPSRVAINLARADGSHVIEISRPPHGFEDHYPTWAPGAGIPKFSPDGSRIMFGLWCIYRDQCPSASLEPRHEKLATIRPDGSGLHRLPLAGVDTGAWCPDAEQIAFRCRASPGLAPARRHRRPPVSALHLHARQHTRQALPMAAGVGTPRLDVPRMTAIRPREADGKSQPRPPASHIMDPGQGTAKPRWRRTQVVYQVEEQ